MKTRIITSVVALAVFAVILLLPSAVFSVALAVVSLIMLYECYCATKADTPMKVVGFLSAILLMGAVVTVYKTEEMFAIAFAVFCTIIILHMGLVIAEHGKKRYNSVLANGFLTLYIVISMSCIWITKEQYGISNMLLIFICAWLTDTCAYFSGRAFGKHKLIPHVSPNKTVEGAIGGAIGSMIACVIYLLITNKIMNINTIWSNIIIEGAVIGLIGGVLSQLGDLTASSIKRDTGIKDFGWVFPGHGGFMDRFDSVVFIAPVMCGLMSLVVMIVR